MRLRIEEHARCCTSRLPLKIRHAERRVAILRDEGAPDSTEGRDDDRAIGSQ
ncbi:hypothetical protein ACWCQL_15475 [Streptomyces sp. NPDC002073]